MIRLPKIITQGDSAWANMRLGTSGLKMKDWGCTFTCGVMIAQAFAKNVDLKKALLEMNAIDGFTTKGALRWLMFAKTLGLDWGYRYETDADPTNKHESVKELLGFQHIERLARFGIPTAVHVDTNHDGKPNHWVVYVGDGYVVDPWDGQLKLLVSFERLYGYAIFTGTPVLVEVYATAKIAAMVGKANEIAHGRNVDLNTDEIMEVIIRP